MHLGPWHRGSELSVNTPCTATQPTKVSCAVNAQDGRLTGILGAQPALCCAVGPCRQPARCYSTAGKAKLGWRSGRTFLQCLTQPRLPGLHALSYLRSSCTDTPSRVPLRDAIPLETAAQADRHARLARTGGKVNREDCEDANGAFLLNRAWRSCKAASPMTFACLNPASPLQDWQGEGVVGQLSAQRAGAVQGTGLDGEGLGDRFGRKGAKLDGWRVILGREGDIA